MFSDWIIIAALIALGAVVVLFLFTGVSDGPSSADVQGNNGKSSGKDVPAQH